MRRYWTDVTILITMCSWMCCTQTAINAFTNATAAFMYMYSNLYSRMSRIWTSTVDVFSQR